MKRYTIKDLARLLQVSPSTISRALSDHPDIGDKTKKRVRQLADELGYKPNYMAANFRKKNSKLIALILPEINMFFFPSVIKAFEEKIHQAGFSLIVFHSNNSLEREMENLELCVQFSVDGILLSVSSQTSNLDHLAEIIDSIPLLLFDRVIPDDAVATITIDDRKVAYQAVELLMERGHEKVCGLFGAPNLYISKERARGMKEAMLEHGVTPDEDFVLYGTKKEVMTQLNSLFDAARYPTAIFAMSDDLLVGIYQLLAQHQLSIPDDVAVICISEGDSPDFFFPKVTYIKHSGEEVAERAAQMLLTLIQKEPLLNKNQLIEPQLIMQDSV